MLKDIIEAQKAKVREKHSTQMADAGFGYFVEYLDINEKDIDIIIDQTAQIVAREVLRKVREGVFDAPDYGDAKPSEVEFAEIDAIRNCRNDILTHLQSLEEELTK